MTDDTLNTANVADETGGENLVRDYLLHQLQLNLLHSQWQDKPHAEAVEELMEAKRTMQEMEDDVVNKFAALNEQYEQINEVIDPQKVQELENYQEMLKEIEQLSAKHKSILDKFDDDPGAYLANQQAITEQLAQLINEVESQNEMIAALNDRISTINSML